MIDKEELIVLANEFYTKLLNLKNDFNRDTMDLMIDLRDNIQSEINAKDEFNVFNVSNNSYYFIKQLKVLYNIYINNIASIELELMAELKSLTKPLKLESLIESVKDD